MPPDAVGNRGSYWRLSSNFSVVRRPLVTGVPANFREEAPILLRPLEWSDGVTLSRETLSAQNVVGQHSRNRPRWVDICKEMFTCHRRSSRRLRPYELLYCIHSDQNE